MRALALLLAGLHGALALPATPGDDAACTSDALFTSLSRDGRSFCSSVLEGRCHQETTPTQYATYEPTVISQHCKCIMTTDTCKERATPTSGLSSRGGAEVTSVTVTRGGSLVTVTLTQTRTPVTGGQSTTRPITSSDPTFGTTVTRGSTSGDSGPGEARSTTRPITSSDPTLGSTATSGSTSSDGGDGFPGRANPSASSSGSSGAGRGTSDAAGSSRGPDTGDMTRGGSTATTTDPGSGSSPMSGSPGQTGPSSPRQPGSSGSTRTGSLSSGTESGRWNASSTALDSSSTRGSSGTAISGSPSPVQSSGSNNDDPKASTSGGAPGSPTTTTLGGPNTGAPPFSSETGSTSPAASRTDAGSGSGGSASSSGSSPGGSASASVVMPSSALPNMTASNKAGAAMTTTLPPAANTTSSTTGSEQTVPAANFTQVKRTGAISEATCYHLPQDPLHGRSRRAVLRNDELRAQNYTIPFPYIESVNFDDDGVDPLFLTLRDAARGTHYIDVSKRSQLSIVDSLGNAMTLDGRGVHFSTNSCRYDVSMTIDGLYGQLATLSGQVCSKGRLVLLEQLPERPDNAAFRQTVNLRDQCGNPVGRAVRKYPELKLGDSECSDVSVDGDDNKQGRWLFDCAFPGPESGAMRCQRAVATDIVKFLFVAPFGGSCPDLSTVITTLEASSQDFLTPASLRAELYDKGLDETQRGEADLAVVYYEQLWEILKQAFSKTRTQPPGLASAIEEYIDTYSSFGSFEGDVCRDLHAPDPPLNMSLRAGATWLPSVAVLSAPPPSPPPALNFIIQDQSKVACCSRGSVSNYGQATPGNASCAYPDSAMIADSGCVCGRTAAGASVAFEYSECDNFVARCATDADCATEGHPGFLCLTGSCCGGGVCIDPYECSRNGTGLLERLAV